MVLWSKRVIASFFFQRWSCYSHPRFLIYVRSKLEVTEHILNLWRWHQSMQLGKSLFKQRFIHYKTFTLGGGGGGEGDWKPKNNHIWVVIVLWSFFIRCPTVQDDHFWEFPRVANLWNTVVVYYVWAIMMSCR